MINVQIGDITKVQNTRYIGNAANGRGPLGAGVAGAIRRAGGLEIQNEALSICVNNDVQPGDVYITGAGTLPYTGVIHLCTMKEPGSPSNITIIQKCLESLIEFCHEEGVKTVAIPALGTGIGGVNKNQVAKLYTELLKDSDIEFIVIDIDEDFISFVNMYLSLR